MLQEKSMIRPKVVVALYPFKAVEGGDLSLEKVSVLKRRIMNMSHFIIT
jgi:hypothetical protein